MNTIVSRTYESATLRGLSVMQIEYSVVISVYVHVASSVVVPVLKTVPRVFTSSVI